jgi:diacylglycerol kinase family enzyme
MRRLLVIVNPHATGVSRELRDAVLAMLELRYRVQAADTKAPGHAVELAQRALCEGYEAVAALGGDGTVNEAANGLSRDSGGGARSALACLPAGQANVFAKMLGLPSDVIGATTRLLSLADQWRPRRIDLGVVNGRRFTFSSGIGVDASVTRRVDSNPRLKARFGPWYYAWAGLSTFSRRYLVGAPRMLVAAAAGENGGAHDDTSADARSARSRACAPADGSAGAGARPVEGITTVVQNGAPFTFFKDRPIEIADGGALDSGKLAGCVLRRARASDLPFLAFRMLSTRAPISAHPQVSSFCSVTELTVQSADGRPLPLQVDGDYLGEVIEARYSILPGALNVLA